MFDFLHWFKKSGRNREFSDAMLIEMVKKGGNDCDTAFEAMQWQFRRLILYKLWNAYQDLGEQTVADCYTDALFSAVQNIQSGSYQQESKLSTYIYRVMENKCLDARRKNTTNKRKGIQVDESLAIAIPEPDPDPRIVRMKALIQLLDEKCRSLLVAYLDGYEMEEMASMFNLAGARSASSRKYQCIEKLKTLFLNERW